MQNVYKKIEPFSYYAVLGCFVALSFLHLLTGYADNGDFSRSVGFIFEKPAGFSSMWPAGGTGEWGERFFSGWVDNWVFLSNWPEIRKLSSISTYKPYLLLQAGLSKLVGGQNADYSVILGSVLSRLILCVVFISAAYHFRRRFSSLPAWIFVALFGVVFVDSAWTAFLNSFYEEQIAIIFLPVFGFLLLRFHENKSARTGFWLLSCATLVGAAKTAYFYLPALSLLFLLSFLSSRKEVVKLTLVAVFFQIVALSPVYFGRYGEINSYHALYFGALKTLSEDDAASIRSVRGNPVARECIGVSAFDPGGKECMKTLRVSYVDVAALIGSHPSVGAKMLFEAFNEGRVLDLVHLGKKIKNSPNFSDLPVFNFWPKIFKHGLNFFVLLVLCFSGILLIRRNGFVNEKERSALIVGVFLAVFGFTQYLVSLGDGFYEMAKHLIVGNYALALSLPFTFAALASVIHRSFSSKAVLKSEGPEVIPPQNR